MKIIQIIAAVGLAASMTVPPAAAAAQQERVVTGPRDAGALDGRQLVTAVVPYGDLNLANPDGVRTLNARVYRVATRLCISGYPEPVALRQDGIRCRDGAVAGAQDQIAEAISRRSSFAGASLTLAARR